MHGDREDGLVDGHRFLSLGQGRGEKGVGKGSD